MPPRIASLLCLWLVVLASLSRGEDGAAVRRSEGELANARWVALFPVSWDGRLLLEAPDRRNAPAPLTAELDGESPELRPLLAAGWAIATTSYRRTGPILADGMADLRALRDQLAAEYGPPRLVVVSGTGMGGLIATLLAERHADEFHGFLARDPQLDLRDPRALRLRCDRQPRGPLLFLFGISTARAVIDYHDRSRNAANAESVVPVLWYSPDSDTEGSQPTAGVLPEAVAALATWAQTRVPPPARLADLPAFEEPPPPAAEMLPSAPPHEAPALPEEPPPSVPVEPPPAH